MANVLSNLPNTIRLYGITNISIHVYIPLVRKRGKLYGKKPPEDDIKTIGKENFFLMPRKSYLFVENNDKPAHTSFVLFSRLNNLNIKKTLTRNLNN